jgi:YD repeat-containing protein
VTSPQDPLGNVTTAESDAEGPAAARTTPDGARECWEFDARGDLARHISQAGSETAFECGAFRRLLARADPDGSRYEFAHDRELRLSSVTNPAGGNWTYEYDAAGIVSAEQDFNGRRGTYAHDAAGRLVEQMNGAGQRRSLVRDALGYVIGQRAADLVTASFEHDVNGALACAANQHAAIEFARDATGRVVAETIGGRALSKAYGPPGNRVSRTTPSGHTSDWQYGALSRALWLDAGDRQITFGYAGANHKPHRWIGPDIAITNEWDHADRHQAGVGGYVHGGRAERGGLCQGLLGRHRAAGLEHRFRALGERGRLGDRGRPGGSGDRLHRAERVEPELQHE